MSRHVLQGGPKNGTVLLNPLTLSNINRFSKFSHCQNQKKICNNIITKDPTTPVMCRYTTLWNVSVLKAIIENKTTSVTTYFKKVTTTCLLSQLLSKVTVTSCSFTSNVQCVRLAAGRRTQAGDATDQWRDQWNAATVCPTQWRSPTLAGWLSWIVDVDRPSAEGHPKQRNRLDSSPGCLGATCQARWTWRSLLTPQVRQCVPSSVWLTVRRPAAGSRSSADILHGCHVVEQTDRRHDAIARPRFALKCIAR